MPVEIRELVIKTEIQSHPDTLSDERQRQYLQSLKQQVIQECLRQLKKNEKKNPLER